MFYLLIKKTLPLSLVSLIALICASTVLAQGTSTDTAVSQSVRDMILRSQAGTQFEQTARVQMDV